MKLSWSIRRRRRGLIHCVHPSRGLENSDKNIDRHSTWIRRNFFWNWVEKLLLKKLQIVFDRKVRFITSWKWFAYALKHSISHREKRFHHRRTDPSGNFLGLMHFDEFPAESEPKFKSSFHPTNRQPYHIPWYLMNISSHHLHGDCEWKEFVLLFCVCLSFHITTTIYNVCLRNDGTFMRMDWEKYFFYSILLLSSTKWTIMTMDAGGARAKHER